MSEHKPTLFNRRQALLAGVGATAGMTLLGTESAAQTTKAGHSGTPSGEAILVRSNTDSTIPTKQLGASMRRGIKDLSAGKYPGLGYSTRENDGILIEKDVAIVLRDGKKIYADVFRPKGKKNIPAIICYAPFGKHPHIDLNAISTGSGVPFAKLSNETIFEVFDPIKWAKDDYAIVTVDAVGNWSSEGEALFFSPEEARAGYDVVEWVAKLDWCSGKIGWGAVSYYAMTAWSVAALRPPHLAAILPWEGASDVFRETYFHGGIPIQAFNHNWQQSVSFSLTQVEDMEASIRNFPLINDYWRSKVADWSKIEVPTYAVTGWPNDLHLRGTIAAWQGTSSNNKYLDIHGGKEWGEFYSDWAYSRQKAFFDHFLKDIANDVPSWPKVRVAQRTGGSTWTFREENEFPLARTRYRQLYLDAKTTSMSLRKPRQEQSITYNSTDPEAGAAFELKFSERTEITGYSKLRLWVAATGTNDADLFIGLTKLDRDGRLVPFTYSQVFDDGPAAVGWLRVSQRELDAELSRPERPVLSHSKHQWLTSHEPVAVDIEIWPTNIVFEPGETLRLIVKGSQVSYHPGNPLEITYGPLNNAGPHIIHTGGRFDSHLLIPIIPEAR